MRIVPFPTDEPLPGQEAWIAELEGALGGELHDPAAQAWRELREDVRTLAPPMTPEFEARLAAELERRGAIRPGGVDGDDVDVPARRSLAAHRRSALAAVAAVAAALVAVLLISGTPRGSGPVIATPKPVESAPATGQGAVSHGTNGGAASPAARSNSKNAQLEPSASAGSSAGEAASPSILSPSPTGAASAPGREQQLGASVTLSTTPANVQATSDKVSQLVVREGGYVQTSNVQVQQQGASEATLALRLPSARLAAALAAIGRLAPVRAESQSLQDITSSYDAAHRQLSDAEAERRALLRALAAATSEGQIDSLHERLAQAASAIARAQASVNAVSQRASTAEVEVSVLGDTHAGSEGLTLHKGLHDAGRVLLVALIAILIMAAVLVPLALVIAALVGGRRSWRRYQRERVLSAP
jgi:hypothetical protein